MSNWIWIYLVLAMVFGRSRSQQGCPTEVAPKAIAVKWTSSQDADNIVSDPICYNIQNQIVTRNCSNGQWTPPLKSMNPCAKVVNYYDLDSCPPGYFKISENSTDFCYQLTEPEEWDFPCLKSGGASTITDLSSDEVNTLLNSLKLLNVSQYYWLPARRQKLFNPAVWTIPGPNWIKKVEGRPSILMQTSIFKNCLLLDVENMIIATEKCNLVYPSLCFYINDVHYPAECPYNYQSFRFMLDDGVCFGVEYSDNVNGSTFDEFLRDKCEKPMGNDKGIDVTRFLYKKMATTMFDMQSHEWCWFSSFDKTKHSLLEMNIQYNSFEFETSNLTIPSFQGVINNDGSFGVVHEMSRLPCMACQKELVYGESEFYLEYNNIDKKIYLTVYLPSGLWKYDQNDKGVRCFSNAKGFPQAVGINEIADVKFSEIYDAVNDTHIEKTVYELNSISDRMAQYWCEGHTKKFSLISTEKVISNPHGDSEHVFALTAQFYHSDSSENSYQDLTLINDVTNTLVEIFDGNKVVVMDILNYTTTSAIILFHVHVTANFTEEHETKQIQEIFNKLEEIALSNFLLHHIDLINISSCIYCLPTESVDAFILEWELTQIGQIAAPKQFCLQKNGLPVKRTCGGSYMLGAKWEPVEGTCDGNYQPSNTTNFLYKFIKGLGPESWTENFMTYGLRFVLDDIDIIIPADIYYISKSLKQISEVARTNRSSLDMGDLENIAWIVDRLMILNNNYLNLAQTLNSTNVILDTITDLIEILALPNTTDIYYRDINPYQIAVKPQFVTQITYPQNNNITGLALIKNTDSDRFTDFLIQPLYKNSTVNEIMEINNLEIATWLPEEVLRNLFILNNKSNEDSDDIHILINVFHNDAIFQEVAESGNFKHLINSRIIEITIPGYNIPPEFSIPLVFRAINITGTRNFCGFWNFQSGDINGYLGQWKREGCYMVTMINGLVVCKCYHLTHFAQLISWHRHGNPESENSSDHSKVLNIITLFGSFLSLLGIAGIWITALVFSMWRKKAGTKVLLQLTTAIALPLILMICFSLDTTIFYESDDEFLIVEHKRGICIGLGALLHYSILAGFVWMLITAILQFIRYVRVLGVRRPAKFMIKMSIAGWGLPTIPVVIVLLVDKNTYIPPPVRAESYNAPICYPNGIYFILAVLVPVGIIIIVNIILFLCVMISIAKGPDGKVRTPDLDLVKAQLRLSIFLFFLLGLTWIFGIFSFSRNYVWSYMFCLTSTIQGFVLFLYFVICDPTTRNLWITLMKPQFRTTASRVSITSISNTT